MDIAKGIIKPESFCPDCEVNLFFSAYFFDIEYYEELLYILETAYTDFGYEAL